MGNLLPKRPAAGALYRLTVIMMLMGLSSSWGNDQSQSDNAPAQGECELNDQQKAMLSQINEARSLARQCGDQQYEAVELLAWSCKLEAAAKSHSQDMAENDYFSNIMNDAFTEMGMAKAEDSESRYSTYWTQTLGNPR